MKVLIAPFSVCGYDTERRQAREAKKKAAKSSHTRDTCTSDIPKWRRTVPYNFHECLAHADITYRPIDGQILRIAGVLSHCAPCQKAHIERRPRIPLHPHAYDTALRQLQSGARFVVISWDHRDSLELMLFFFCQLPGHSRVQQTLNPRQLL